MKQPAQPATVKKRHLYPALLLIASGAFITGCGDSEPEQTDSKFQYQGPSVSADEMAALEEKKIEMTGDDKMMYDVISFEVVAGQRVTVVFKNVGTMPKASMGHNVVFLKRGVDSDEFVEAGSMQAGNDYIDPARDEETLAKSKLLGPGETDTFSFIAPREPGENEFVCTFPGHYTVGMRGKMIVTPAN